MLFYFPVSTQFFFVSPKNCPRQKKKKRQNRKELVPSWKLFPVLVISFSSRKCVRTIQKIGETTKHEAGSKEYCRSDSDIDKHNLSSLLVKNSARWTTLLEGNVLLPPQNSHSLELLIPTFFQFWIQPSFLHQRRLNDRIAKWYFTLLEIFEIGKTYFLN